MTRANLGGWCDELLAAWGSAVVIDATLVYVVFVRAAVRLLCFGVRNLQDGVLHLQDAIHFGGKAARGALTRGVMGRVVEDNSQFHRWPYCRFG